MLMAPDDAWREIRGFFVLSPLSQGAGQYDNNTLLEAYMTMKLAAAAKRRWHLRRYGRSGTLPVGRFISARSGSQIPWGTLIINITGAFLIGLVFALTAQKLFHRNSNRC